MSYMVADSRSNTASPLGRVERFRARFKTFLFFVQHIPREFARRQPAPGYYATLLPVRWNAAINLLKSFHTSDLVEFISNPRVPGPLGAPCPDIKRPHAVRCEVLFKPPFLEKVQQCV